MKCQYCRQENTRGYTCDDCEAGWPFRECKCENNGGEYCPACNAWIIRRQAEVRAGKIETDYICPPIPIRNFDYCAWFSGPGPEWLQGFGETKGKAIADLMFQLEEKDLALPPS